MEGNLWTLRTPTDIVYSSPESTLPLDPGVVNTVRLYNRSYQEFSIENSTYCVPIDEVR